MRFLRVCVLVLACCVCALPVAQQPKLVRPLAMLRSLFVVAAACCAHSAVAFSTAAPMALGTRNRAVAHGLARKQFRPARMPALRMVDEPKQVIDFGKVGFSDAENQVCTRPAHGSGCARARPGDRPAVFTDDAIARLLCAVS